VPVTLLPLVRLFDCAHIESDEPYPIKGEFIREKSLVLVQLDLL